MEGGERSCGRGATSGSLREIIGCLPATMDLSRDEHVEHFHLLASRMNASNAKFVSDAMANIARRIPDEHFLQVYLPLIQSEQMIKLGKDGQVLNVKEKKNKRDRLPFRCHGKQGDSSTLERISRSSPVDSLDVETSVGHSNS